MTYGDMIRTAREAHGWTQDDLKEYADVPKRTIQEIEAGRVKKPHRSTDLKLRQALELEGNADEERAEWPEDVAKMIDIVAATLLALPPGDRVQWFADFLTSDITREGGASHPSGG